MNIGGSLEIAYLIEKRLGHFSARIEGKACCSSPFFSEFLISSTFDHITPCFFEFPLVTDPKRRLSMAPVIIMEFVACVVNRSLMLLTKTTGINVIKSMG